MYRTCKPTPTTVDPRIVCAVRLTRGDAPRELHAAAQHACRDKGLVNTTIPVVIAIALGKLTTERRPTPAPIVVISTFPHSTLYIPGH
jgi:hypothetical protein